MRRLTILVLVLAGLYSGYWFFGARAVETAAQDTLTGLSQTGWDIAGTSAQTRGFPSRFDTTFSDVDLTSPDRTIRYQTAFFQAFALSYQPNRVILIAAPQHIVDMPGLRLTLDTNGLRASAAVGANTDLSFESFTAEAADVAISSDLGIGASGRKLLIASRPAGPAAHRYDLYFGLVDLILPAINAQPAPIDTLILDTALTFTATLDRHTMTGPPPRIDRIEVKALTIDWAGATIRGDGELRAGSDGFLEGEVMLNITDHATLIDQLAAVGSVDPGVAPTWLNVANAMTAGGDVLSLPLKMGNGRMSLGPFPMGPAPRVR